MRKILKYTRADMVSKHLTTKVKYPLTVYLKITTNCMLKCNFCSQAGRKSENMILECVKRFLDELKKCGVVYIYYTGGEPLMHSNIGEILKYGYELGFKQFLVSNGYLFSKEENRILTKYLIGIGISLHGKPETHDALVGLDNCFEKVVDNLKRVKEYNDQLVININCTVTNKNNIREDIQYLSNICLDNGWKLTFARLNYIGNGLKYSYVDLNQMLKMITELNNNRISISNCIAPCTVEAKYSYLTHGCGAGQTIAAIESNGDVKICASSNVALGNLNKTSFKSIWNSRLLKKYRKLKFIPKQCKLCSSFITCKAGCKAELTGEFWNGLCDATVQNMMNAEWQTLKNNKIKLSFEYLRKERFNKYLIIGARIRLCNDEVKQILQKIDGNKTGQEIIELYNGKNDELKYLLVLMKKEKLIEI